MQCIKTQGSPGLCKDTEIKSKNKSQLFRESFDFGEKSSGVFQNFYKQLLRI